MNLSTSSVASLLDEHENMTHFFIMQKVSQHLKSVRNVINQLPLLWRRSLLDARLEFYFSVLFFFLPLTDNDSYLTANKSAPVKLHRNLRVRVDYYK